MDRKKLAERHSGARLAVEPYIEELPRGMDGTEFVSRAEAHHRANVYDPYTLAFVAMFLISITAQQ